ncbi:MAG TPA: hypothetical protein VGS08_04475 [Candidatus Saccharimonadales bacterium]|nr:hypothetical protein [Candidatus Saccharimonadales bacterium]
MEREQQVPRGGESQQGWSGPPRARSDQRHEPGERPRVQRFQFGPWVFNVDRAQAVIVEDPRETRSLPVQPWALAYGLDRLDSNEGRSFSLFTPLPGFDRRYVMPTDLDEPVIVATLRSNQGEEFPLLIDGTHRLYRAHVEGVEKLSAHVLSAEESLSIREDSRIGPVN